MRNVIFRNKNDGTALYVEFGAHVNMKRKILIGF